MSTFDSGAPGPDDRPGEPPILRAGPQLVESRLRDALEHDAAQIRPRERLDAILAEATGRPARDTGRRLGHRWLLSVAAAALVAAVAVGIQVKNGPTREVLPGDQASRSGSPASVTASPTWSSRPSVTPTAAPPTSAPSTGDTALGGPPWIGNALAVYHVGVVTSAGQPLGLVREFVPQTTSAGNPTERTLKALRLAVVDDPATMDAGYRPVWSGVGVTSVDVAADQIVIALTTGAKGLSASEANLAVQQLVWTAQAASGTAALLPVRFVLADGSSVLAGPLTTAHAYNRPRGDLALSQLLAPIWIDTPYAVQQFTPGAQVTVSGQASVFEGNLVFTVARAGAPYETGTATASTGAPGRGTYSFTTTPLPAGDYSVTVLSTSPKDGSVLAQRGVPFVVR